MQNTEKDYRDQVIAGSMAVEKLNDDYNKRTPGPADPNEIKGRLTIIDKFKKQAENNSAKEDALKEAEGNNYTAAENEHQTNSTL
jgi:hypothetical protein